MQPFWAVVQTTYREALRNRLLLTLCIGGAFLILIGLLLQAATPQDRLKLVQAWVFSVTHFFSIFLVLVIAGFSLPRDRDERRIQTVVTKPIHPALLFFGKWVGSALVSATSVGILALMGAGIVLHAASGVHADDPGTKVRPTIHAASMASYGLTETEDGSWEAEIITHEESFATFVYSPEQIARFGDGVMLYMNPTLRYIEGETSEEIRLANRMYVQIHLEERAPGAEPRLLESRRVEVKNQSPLILEPLSLSNRTDAASDVAVRVIPDSKGLALVLTPETYHVLGTSESFLLNWLISTFLLTCQLSVLAGFAVIASGFLSGPVSFFVGLVIYGIALFHSFFIRAIEHSYLYVEQTREHVGHVHHGPGDMPPAVVEFSSWIATQVLRLVPDLSRFKYTELLADNRALPGGSFAGGIGVLVVTAVLVALGGWLMTRRKEMA
jgi:hypothetical protein